MQIPPFIILYMSYFIIIILVRSAKKPQSFLSLHRISGNIFENRFCPRQFVQANTFTFHILLYLREQCISEKEVKV
ncbi:hypothetical protein BSUW23_18500 [Bacillus spizizenii str. W23]|uniref:Uncharacterized protein n=1 Tax=Bacillus spizizenii (strain ATCC 23059 / NRRL B-14472 / W23) TaxID=655816 RepID=E0TVF3_BACSH|nr:hypothetical protein BSUW23_18500 [Bacillus spizizenii str. W23]AJW85192.1 hypothetical protein BIS30_08450 [Bacillus spizizenii]EFG92377.1 hypothetical protein BSU6633_09786 [Bacillus spizizenii ATCC 6633 = JCM 2499]KFI02569.1 hypothetical protein JN25_13665 [Bacillus sp. BSC154]MBK4204871.1 hypothetical protein [Bacillus subtilis]